ncbi:RNA polymerase II associated protein 1 [Branchiostoma belcheri]|nr:RNA polymerase II associated protein 1 [Branchiostoma belcheri]
MAANVKFPAKFSYRARSLSPPERMYSARPKPEDTEEDLLKSQREFLAAETAGSAKVVRKPEQRDREKQTTARDVVDLEGGGLPPQLPSFETGSKPSKKTSRFKQRRKRKNITLTIKDLTTISTDPQVQDGKKEEEFDAEEEMETHDTHVTKVLTEIVVSFHYAGHLFEHV